MLKALRMYEQNCGMFCLVTGFFALRSIICFTHHPTPQICSRLQRLSPANTSFQCIYLLLLSDKLPQTQWLKITPSNYLLFLQLEAWVSLTGCLLRISGDRTATGLLPAGSGEAATSELVQVAGLVQFPAARGLRSLFLTGCQWEAIPCLVTATKQTGIRAQAEVKLSDKESICQCKRFRFNPWVRKIPWRRKQQATLVFLPGESHGQRSLAGCSLWGCKESDMTQQLNNSNTGGS